MQDLINATKNSDLETMQEILSSNTINIDAQDKEGNTALTIAFNQNDQEKMVLLLQYGADKELAGKNLSNKKKKTFKRLCDQIQTKEKSIDYNAGGIDLMSSLNTSSKVNEDILFLSLVAKREYETAEWLLPRVVDVNCKSQDDKSTALIYAAEDGRNDMVKLLLNKGALINIQNNKGTTALIAATWDGHSDVVKTLLDNGADVNIQDNNGCTALITASQDGHAETVEELLRHKKIKVNLKKEFGSTALILAAGWNHGKTVELLLKHPDVNINLQTDEGDTALMVASQNGHSDVVKILLRNGADVNIKNNNGFTALMHASEKGYNDVVQLLLKKGADVNSVGIIKSSVSMANNYSGLSKPQNIHYSHGDITPLMTASEQGYIKTVKELLKDKKIKINMKNSDGITPLMIASQNGHSDVVKILLRNGADVNIQDNDGFTALMFAVQNGHTEAVQELLNHENIDVNLRKIDRGTALILAALDGYRDIVELLLKHKNIDVNLQDYNGATAILLASQQGYSDIIKMLREKGADVNIESKYGITPLLYAVRFGHIEAVQELLKYENIDVNKLYGLCRTPALFLAIQTGNTEIAKILLNRSDININIQNCSIFRDFTYLMFATIYGHEDIVKLLLDKKEDVNKKFWGGLTPLMIAVGTGNARIVKLLLDQPDIDVNAQNKNGETALSMAENQKYGRRIAKLIRAKLGIQPVEPFREKVKYPTINKINEKFLKAVSKGNISDMYSMLEENADGKILVDINAKNKSGDTALIIAADNGNLDAVKILLNENVDLILGDKNGNNALIRAAKKGHLDVVDVILQKKNIINSTGQHKRTALMVAAENGKVRVVKLLIKKGAKISVKDDNGNTALDLLESKSGGDYQTIKEILKKKLAQRMDTLSDSMKQINVLDTWEISKKECEKDLENWKKNAPETYNKILSLLDMMKLDPFGGIGQCERLKGDLKGLYSRRINEQDRLVYEVDGEKIILKSCKGHYEDLKRSGNRS